MRLQTTLLPDGCQLHMSMWAPENCKKRAAMAAKPAPVVTNPTPAVAKSVPVAAKVVKFAQNAGRNGIKISPATSTTKARCYSSGELLHLRSSLPAINGVASKFKNNPHIGMVFKLIHQSQLLTRIQLVLKPPFPIPKRRPEAMKKSLSVTVLRLRLSFVAELWISRPDHHFSGFGVSAPSKRLDGLNHSSVCSQ